MYTNASDGKRWSDGELKVAVDCYLYMLRLQLSGVSFSVEEMAGFLTEEALLKRNNASVRYRMRNISYVFDKRKLPTLKGYSPASSVGSGVEKRISELLDERLESLHQVAKIGVKEGKKAATLDAVLLKLDHLEEFLLGMGNGKISRMGHNNPPEPIEDSLLDVKAAVECVQNIKKEIASSFPNKEKIGRDQSALIKFVIKSLACMKEHFSLFSKSAVVAAGAGAGSKLLELGSYVADTLESLSLFIRTLG